MARGKEEDDKDKDRDSGDASGEENPSNVQATSNSNAIGAINIDGDQTGQIIIGDNHTLIDNRNGVIVKVSPALDQPPYSMGPFPVHLVPEDFPFLLDRDEEFKFAKDAIKVFTSVSIFGKKGSGKTSFLKHLINRTNFSEFSHGVVYLNVSGRGLDDLLQFLFQSFSTSYGYKPTNDVILHEFQKLNALIFLDDLELDFDKTDVLREYAPGCTFILSSVEQRLSGKRKNIPLDGLPDEDAVTLFEQELASFLNAHPLNEEEHAAARKLCALYQGQPSRIVFAAHQVATRENSIFQLLEDSKQGDPESVLRQAALNRLTAYQENVLAILAVVGGSELLHEHLVSLVQDPHLTKTLHGLITLGLIQEDNGRYSLTGNLASSLAVWEDLSIWEDRLLDHFTHWLEGKPEQARIEASTEALLYLLKKASEKRKWSPVVLLGIALEPSLILGKRWQAWEELLNQILNAAKALGDRKVEAWVLHQMGSRAMFLGQDDQAQDLLTEALDIRKSIHDQGGLKVTQHNLNTLLRIPVPPNIPRVPPTRFPPFVPWVIGGLALAAIALLALILLLSRGLSSVPGIAATSMATNTFTPTPTRTHTPTSTKTPTSIPTRTLSLTPCTPMFTLNEDAFLRTGPGTAYPTLTAIEAGDNVEILARNADTNNTWYYSLWHRFNVMGWISSVTGQTSCVTVTALTVIVPPPPPSQTPPPYP